MAPRMDDAGTHAWGEHVGELELRLAGPDEAAVLAAAVRAMAELLGGEAAPRAAVERREVEATGADRAALLAGWLEELVFLAEAEGFVPVALECLALEADRVRGRVGGYLGEPPHLVKAVTYHRLAFEPAGEGWRGTAVLDV